MAVSFSLQSVVLALLSVYYRLFKRIDYAASEAKRESKIKTKTDSPEADAELEAMMSRIDPTALHEFLITSVLKSERYSRDSRQWQKLRNCYHPDPSKTRIEVAA